MNPRIVIPMIFAVLVIWVVGAAITKFSLEQMALLAPVAVVVVGATIGVASRAATGGPSATLLPDSVVAG